MCLCEGERKVKNTWKIKDKEMCGDIGEQGVIMVDGMATNSLSEKMT